MPRSALVIRYKRSIPGDHSSYGADVEQALARLTGRDRQLSSTFSSRARLALGGGFVERHEDGPELWITLIEQIPHYVTAAIALAAVWRNRKKARRSERTTIRIAGSGSEHTIEIRDDSDLTLVRALIRHHGRVAQNSKSSAKTRRSKRKLRSGRPGE